MKVGLNRVAKEKPKYPYLAEQKGSERGRIAMFVGRDQAVVISQGVNRGWDWHIGCTVHTSENAFEVFDGTITLSN